MLIVNSKSLETLDIAYITFLNFLNTLYKLMVRVSRPKFIILQFHVIYCLNSPLAVPKITHLCNFTRVGYPCKNFFLRHASKNMFTQH